MRFGFEILQQTAGGLVHTYRSLSKMPGIRSPLRLYNQK